MKFLLLSLITLSLITKISYSQLSGTYYVGSGQTYTSFTGSGSQGFFNAVNTQGLSGNVTVFVTSNTSESGAVSLNQWTGNFTITIRPNSAVVYNISGDVNSPLINLNGADNLIIDGRFDGSGRYLRFTNLNTDNPVFRFINDAKSNVITYCIIEGLNSNLSSGLIFFSITNGNDGNDNNTISNCLIRSSGGNYINAIYSNGTTSTSQRNNSGISVTDNEIIDFFRDGFIASGITLTGGSTEWTISGNSFYQTSSRSVTQATGWNVIYVNTSSANNITVSGNYLGGSAANCGGSPWTVSGSVTITSYFIRFASSGTSTASNIQNNYIQNYSQSANPSSGGYVMFAGISVEGGLVHSSGNIIGNTSSTGNITLTYAGNTNNIINRGINYANCTGNITGNTIGSITINGSHSSGLMRFEAINYTGTPTATVTISNNTIGSTSTSGSINASSPSMYFQMSGIYSTINTVTLNVTGNTLANIVNTSTNSNAWTRGIFQNNSTSAICNFSNNTLSEIYSSGTNTSRFPNSCPIIGIYTGSNSTAQVISGNTVRGLRSNANADIHVQGIAHYNSAGKGLCEKNKIYDLTNTSTSSAPKIWAINAFWGSWNFYNNQITLTNGESAFRYSSSNYTIFGNTANIEKKTSYDDSEILSYLIKDEEHTTPETEKKPDNPVIPFHTNGVEIKGIHDEAEFDCVFAYNSIYVGGTASSGNSNSWCYDRPLTSWPTPAKILNNLFFNARTGGTGKHYAIGNEIGSNNWTSTSANYNVYISSNINTITIWGTSDQTIDQWRTSSGGDKQTWSTTSSSLNASNLFNNISQGDLSIKTANYEAWIVSGKGIALSSVNSDYNGNSRATNISGGCTDIGAFEFTSTPPNCPVAVQDNVPGSGVTSTYRLWGRNLVVINWGTGGSQYPSMVNVQYYSGVNPPNTVGGNYSNSYWDINPVGSLNGATYDITINFGDNETYTITSPSINTRIAKYVSTWEVFSTAGTGAWQTELNWSNLNAKTRAMNSFSVYSLTDASNPLPVEICSFSGLVTSRNVELKWSTCWEINNMGFDIERRDFNKSNSSYGEWKKIGFVQGAGTSNEEKHYKFTDAKLLTGQYQYRLKQIDFNGNHEYYQLNSPSEIIIGTPQTAELYQNYPNPSNPSSKIDFQIPFSGRVTLKVYDISGREVASLLDRELEAGYYSETFNGSSLASGVYFYRISVKGTESENFSKTMKLILIK
ncbi:MAG: T9SS type A sorting domain-containing protein [Ignavibacteria bacterium]|nr:T9SS type A sorting domain-containing protein [Ignavibacteria bacterium]